jgi:RNA polymerase sigma factor (sigma-70 family)
VLSNSEQTELALRARNDRDALGDLIVEFDELTRNKIRHRVPLRDVDDVFQEVMLSLVCSIRKFRGDSQFCTWFWSLTERRIVDYYRHMARDERNKMEKPETGVEGKGYGSNLDYADVTKGLSSRDKEVIYKFYVDGMSYQQIADEKGDHYEKVRSLVRRAIGRARENLEEKGALK